MSFSFWVIIITLFIVFLLLCIKIVISIDEVFTVTFYCDNCENEITMIFPKGTKVYKASWGVLHKSGATLPNGNSADMTCKKCGYKPIR